MDASPYSQAARQFVELWQKQMSAMMNDRDFIHTMLDMLRMQDSPSHAPRPAPANADAADAAVSPGALLKRLDRLERSLLRLEQRLNSAETAEKPKQSRARGGKKPARKPAARR